MYRKSRSTLEGRGHALRRFKHVMGRVPAMTDAEIAQEITRLRSFSCDPDTPRENLIIELAVCLASYIVDAA